jgi:hypothetical protein
MTQGEGECMGTHVHDCNYMGFGVAGLLNVGRKYEGKLNRDVTFLSFIEPEAVWATTYT